MELKFHLEKVEDRKKNVSIFCLNVMAHAIWIEYATLSSKKKLTGIPVEKGGSTDS